MSARDDALAAWERRIRTETRRDAALRGCAAFLTFGGAAVALLELVARTTPFPSLRAFETGAIFGAAIVGAIVAAKAARAAPPWTIIADRRASEPDVVSAALAAAADGAPSTRLSPVVRARGAVAAAVGAASRAAAIDRAPLRRAAPFVVAALVLAAIPWRADYADAAPASLREAILRDSETLRTLADDLVDPTRRAAAVRAADHIRRAPGSAEAAADAAKILRLLGAQETLEALRRLAAAAPRLKPLLDAARRRDAAAVEAARDALKAALAADPKLREAFAAELANAPTDGIGAAASPIAEAKAALAGGDGSSAVDVLARHAVSLSRAAAAEGVVRDVVVRLDALAAFDPTVPAPGSAPPPERRGSDRTPGGAAANAGPLSGAAAPRDDRLAPPGSIEAEVVRRYFASDAPSK